MQLYCRCMCENTDRHVLQLETTAASPHKTEMAPSVYLLEIHSAQLISGQSCVTHAREQRKQHGHCSCERCFFV